MKITRQNLNNILSVEMSIVLPLISTLLQNVNVVTNVIGVTYIYSKPGE